MLEHMKSLPPPTPTHTGLGGFSMVTVDLGGEWFAQTTQQGKLAASYQADGPRPAFLVCCIQRQILGDRQTSGQV